LNIFNVLQNMVNWNNSIINILDPELHAGIYANCTVVAQPFLSLNDGDKKNTGRVLGLSVASQQPAARHIQILPTNQYACWPITFGIKGSY
jgi:hypothetical protein